VFVEDVDVFPASAGSITFVLASTNCSVPSIPPHGLVTDRGCGGPPGAAEAVETISADPALASVVTAVTLDGSIMAGLM
jgi:hypothetical protein